MYFMEKNTIVFSIKYAPISLSHKVVFFTVIGPAGPNKTALHLHPSDNKYEASSAVPKLN